jgi:Ca2+-binding RTX toxin-like protein
MSAGFNIFASSKFFAPQQFPAAPIHTPYQAPVTHFPGVNISQTGFNNFNLAVGTPGADQINQTGGNGVFLAFGLGGADNFSINGNNNVSIHYGSAGNDNFLANGTNGFYKFYGGGGFDTLTLQGQKSDWKQLDPFTYFNSSTNTRVLAHSIEQINYTA